jgi:hypothetical protein
MECVDAISIVDNEIQVLLAHIRQLQEEVDILTDRIEALE